MIFTESHDKVKGEGANGQERSEEKQRRPSHFSKRKETKDNRRGRNEPEVGNPEEERKRTKMAEEMEAKAFIDK
ncbi:hypothetical protein RUM43_013936 [Polyplax serrata]|uniref:Uncharacterized protein n=1 Tax=Polyplax serrata TaxID=468196 RepID=A0AAN8S3R4_POLSC